MRWQKRLLKRSVVISEPSGAGLSLKKMSKKSEEGGRLLKNDRLHILLITAERKLTKKKIVDRMDRKFLGRSRCI